MYLEEIPEQWKSEETYYIQVWSKIMISLCDVF